MSISYLLSLFKPPAHPLHPHFHWKPCYLFTDNVRRTEVNLQTSIPTTALPPHPISNFLPLSCAVGRQSTLPPRPMPTPLTYSRTLLGCNSALSYIISFPFFPSPLLLAGKPAVIPPILDKKKWKGKERKIILCPTSSSSYFYQLSWKELSTFSPSDSFPPFQSTCHSAPPRCSCQGPPCLLERSCQWGVLTSHLIWPSAAPGHTDHCLPIELLSLQESGTPTLLVFLLLHGLFCRLPFISLTFWHWSPLGLYLGTSSVFLSTHSPLEIASRYSALNWL